MDNFTKLKLGKALLCRVALHLAAQNETDQRDNFGPIWADEGLRSLLLQKQQEFSKDLRHEMLR